MDTQKKKKKRKVMNKNCVLLKEKIKQKRYTSKEEREEGRRKEIPNSISLKTVL